MKGLILSGGTGTRLRPITHTNAKQLVPIANKPILLYGLEDMVEAGITDIGVVVGETRADIESLLGDGSAFGASITYIQQEAPLGLAHCVRIAAAFLGDEAFVMYLGDNMLQQGLKGIVERFQIATRDDPAVAAQILLSQVANPERFGVAEVDDTGRVVRLVEKPSEPLSDLALVGVYVFGPSIQEAVHAIQPSTRGELEITDAIQWLIDHDRVVLKDMLHGWWLDTGKKDPLLEANRRVLDELERRIDGEVDAQSELDGRVVVEAGARIVNSSIRGPVIIGEGTRVSDSYIGPYTSIDRDCVMEHSEIENSVILAETQVLGVPRMVDSLIGRAAIITRTRRRPRAARLLIGDHCSVDLD